MPIPPPLVDVSVEGRVGRVVLDRPTAINALTLGMIRRVRAALDDWRDAAQVELVVVSGNGDRGFCAGGDIRAVHEGARSDPEAVRRLWREEYALDASLASYPKPVVSIAHGLTMGGGVGLACHVRHRVVTDDLVLAMPEVMIGLAPDVAGLWLLARSPGELGTHAALTGVRLGAADAYAAGLADCVIPAAGADDLLEALRHDDPEPVLAAFDDAPRESTLLQQRGWIDQCYRGDDVEVIHARLRAHPEPAAARAAAALEAASPTAVAVTLAAIRRARRMTGMRQCLEQDYRVGKGFLKHPDLSEGIRAQLIDKDRQPRWEPASLWEVDHAAVAEFFTPDGPDLDLTRVP